MSDSKTIDPKVMAYLAMPESERVATPSEHFADAKKEGVTKPDMWMPKGVQAYRIVFCLDFFDDKGERYVRRDIPLLGIHSDEVAMQRFREWKAEHPRGFESHAYSRYPELERIVVLETW